VFSRCNGAEVIRIGLIFTAAALFAAPAAAAGRLMPFSFRDQAAEVNAASRFLSAYGTVTSTFRTVAHNRAVGGVPNSYHLLDRAIDLARRPGITHRQIEAALLRAGYNLVESLDEHDHSHFAFASVGIAPAPVRDAPEPPPSPPPPPLLAADVHGTLNLDVEAQAAKGSDPQALSR
jgi:hypothetical protein